MRRLAFAALTLGLSLSVVLAQEKAEAKHESEAASEERLEIWKWANFAILAAGLGYLAVKQGGPFFASRSAEIRKGITDAEALRKDADSRAAEVDRRLANLESDVKQMRATVLAEQAAAAERLRQETAAELARIQDHAGREIESAAKAARVELKRYAARLAIDLAEQKIRSRMNAESQGVLVDDFVRSLDHHA
jgi:F-type H+-transporting ATPase subunit b